MKNAGKAVRQPVAVLNGFAFTTTYFDDGWTSIVKEDWVQVTKADMVETLVKAQYKKEEYRTDFEDLMVEGVIDNRYGRWVNNNFADYHVPVHADVPHIETHFVNKPDPVLNPMGSKGMGEVSMIGFPAAVANAVFHATGKRVRELPITLDKLI